MFIGLLPQTDQPHEQKQDPRLNPAFDLIRGSKMLWPTLFFALLGVVVLIDAMPYYAPLQGTAGGKRTLVVVDNMVHFLFPKLIDCQHFILSLFCRMIYRCTPSSFLT